MREHTHFLREEFDRLIKTNLFSVRKRISHILAFCILISSSRAILILSRRNREKAFLKSEQLLIVIT